MAARKSLTDVAIKNLKPDQTRREVRDPGAPGLYVVIQPSGVKSFAVRYELKGGKSVKLTLGRWVPPGAAKSEDHNGGEDRRSDVPRARARPRR